MKHFKRFFAIAGVILLLGMYGASLVLALMDSPQAFQWLQASIVATVIIPILLWIYIAMFKFIEQRRNENLDALKNDEESDD